MANITLKKSKLELGGDKRASIKMSKYEAIPSTKSDRKLIFRKKTANQAKNENDKKSDRAIKDKKQFLHEKIKHYKTVLEQGF